MQQEAHVVNWPKGATREWVWYVLFFNTTLCLAPTLGAVWTFLWPGIWSFVNGSMVRRPGKLRHIVKLWFKGTLPSVTWLSRFFTFKSDVKGTSLGSTHRLLPNVFFGIHGE